MSDAAKENVEATDKGNANFTIQNIYLKDSSFETPNTPQIFNEKWQPKLDFDMQIDTFSLGEDLHEVVLHVTLTVKIGEEKVAFLIEVQQAGIFTIQDFPEDVVKRILATTCPTILFPYVREAVSNFVTKGGFPQLALPPINFEALHAQREKEQQDKPE